MEETELGARPEHLVELYQSIARNCDEIQKQEGYYHARQIPRIKRIIKNFDKAQQIRERLDGDKNKTELGHIYNRMSFYYNELKMCQGLLGEDEADCKKKADDHIEKAIRIFNDLHDRANVADCIITKGGIQARGVSEQEKYYKEAQEMLLQSVGEIHYSMARVYLNLGIYYEDHFKIPEAFECFYKWYLLMVDLYGKEHNKTVRAIETLREPRYAMLCQKEGIKLDELG